MSKIEARKAFDKKKILPAAIVFICFGASVTFSIFLMKSQGAELWAMIVFGALGVGLEMAKFHFPATALTAKDLHMGIRFLFGFVGIGAIVFSLVASFALAKNQASTIHNDFIYNSTEFKTQQKKIVDRDRLINRLNAELKDLENEKIKEVGKFNPVKYRTLRERTATKYNKLIHQKSDELTKLQKEGLDVKLSSFSPATNIDKGFTGVFTKKSHEDIFFGFVAILIEVVGVLALVELKRKNRKVLKRYTVYEDAETLVNTERSNNSDKNVIDIDSKKKQRSDVTSTLSEEIEIEEALQLYAQAALQKIEQNPNDTSCPGLTAMAKKLNYSRDKLRKAKDYLERKKILKVDGLTTFVNDLNKLKKYA
jgi:hypothetical protein